MAEAPSSGNYGTARERAATVSFADIDAAARQLMATGGYPSVAAVRKVLKRGSTTTIAEAMRRFWKDQAALNTGNPVALTRLPPEFADAAVGLWEQALRLSQQTAKTDDNAARSRLEELKREATHRIHSVELREKEWDMAARVRERALSEARDQVGVLVGELAAAHAEIRSQSLRTAELQTEMEHLRQQLATVIARAVARHRSRPKAAPNRRSHFKVAPRRRPRAKARARPAKRAVSIKFQRAPARSATQGKARPAARRRS